MFSNCKNVELVHLLTNSNFTPVGHFLFDTKLTIQFNLSLEGLEVCIEL